MIGKTRAVVTPPQLAVRCLTDTDTIRWLHEKRENRFNFISDSMHVNQIKQDEWSNREKKRRIRRILLAT